MKGDSKINAYNTPTVVAMGAILLGEQFYPTVPVGRHWFV